MGPKGLEKIKDALSEAFTHTDKNMYEVHPSSLDEGEKARFINIVGHTPIALPAYALNALDKANLMRETQIGYIQGKDPSLRQLETQVAPGGNGEGSSILLEDSHWRQGE